MSNLKRRIATLEKAAGLGRGPHGTIEFHATGGSSGLDYMPCDLRAEHGPACALQVVSRNQSGTPFMRLYGFDPAELD